MSHYAILVYPAANRVYADSASRLLCAELAVFSNAVLSTPALAITESKLGGVNYVRFDTEAPLTTKDISVLSNLSSLYVLFELLFDLTDDALLKPIALNPIDKFDSDLLTIQKYPGKTNELFTKLLLNVTLLSTDSPTSLLDGRVRVLDPLCGRGTTLNQAMMYGFDATGLDVDGKDFEAYSQFIKTWLRTKRVKHTADATTLRRNKIRLGRQLEVEYGTSKESYKAGDIRKISYLNCDTTKAESILKAGSVDVIVTDAPYGVQHGSHRTTQPGLARSPRELLAAAVPGWARVLRPGGAIGISWNTHVASREEVSEILAKSKLEVREDSIFTGFEHRVDQAILRDLIVATKPSR